MHQLAYVVDEAGPVPVLDDLHRPDSTPSVQGEALAPAWNSVWVDPFPDPHSTPGIEADGGKRNVRTDEKKQKKTGGCQL